MMKQAQRGDEHEREQGFTLIELMIVVALLAVLAGLIFLKMGATEAKAKGKLVVSQAKAVESAMLQYRRDNHQWPTSLNQLFDGTAPNGKIYTDPIKPVIGTAVTLTQKPFNTRLAAAGAGGAGPNSFVLTYTGATGQEALSADMTADSAKTPNSGLVHVKAGAGGAGKYDVDVFVMTSAAY